MFKPTILIDFDETITQTRGFNDPPNPSAVKAIDELKGKFKIVIFSCRANKNVRPVMDELLMRDYLFKHKIHYDDVCTRKPVFFALIEDRAYNPKLTSWEEITKTLLEEPILD